MKNKNIRYKKLIIFDMDGTLYSFKEGSFAKSKLKKEILKNALIYIKEHLSKSNTEAIYIMKQINKKYGENISLALEKEYGIDRYDYFNKVWNISAKKFINKNSSLRDLLLKINGNYDYILVSDAPRIWVNNVLEELEIYDLFEGKIYSGEGNQRKSFGNFFQYVADKLGYDAINCIVIGDQENTDIIPAKKNGMNAILIMDRAKFTQADFVLNNILDLKNILSSS